MFTLHYTFLIFEVIYILINPVKISDCVLEDFVIFSCVKLVVALYIYLCP